MKKQTVKKLALTRETLRSLEEDAMQAVGGFPTTGQYSCAPTCFRSCKTCDC